MICFKHWSLFIWGILTCLTLHAEDAPLKIGTEGYAPPYVIQNATGQFSGFEISMMQNLCKKMQRTCQFETMPFEKIINSIVDRKIDMGVSAIAITPEREKLVNFSLPYLILNLRVLTRTNISKKPFSYAAFDNKSIGILKGTIIERQLALLPIKNPKVYFFENVADQLLALQNKKIDFILMGNFTALYWQYNSSNQFHTFGDPIPGQFDIGIAVNPKETQLLASLNLAIKEYLNDNSFKENYDMYLLPFNEHSM